MPIVSPGLRGSTGQQGTGLASSGNSCEPTSLSQLLRRTVTSGAPDGYCAASSGAIS